MGMPYKKKFAIRDGGRYSIANIFHRAKTYGYDSSQLNKDYMDFVEKQPKSTPKWIKDYWNGVKDVHYDLIQRNDLEFCYLLGDVRVSIRPDSPIYYKKLGYNVRELTDKPNGYYWIKTGKPYFIGENK